jgi:murein L,D-transpeptidase YafK
MKNKLIFPVVLLLVLAVLGGAVLLYKRDSRRQPVLIGKPAPQAIKSDNADTLPLSDITADRVLIEKHTRRLTLFSRGRPVKTYRIALGRRPTGAKTMEGDGKTPEGSYVIDHRKPDSQFHRALRISYPNRVDRRRAAAGGVAPGGDIMIHGLPNGMGKIGALHRAYDWTNGCIAVTDDEIDEIWRAVPNGTSVEIVP